jgi:hypothetical protein
MEEIRKDKPEEEKEPKPGIKPGGAGFTIKPVSSPVPSSKPVTPPPKVPPPPGPFPPGPVSGTLEKEKKDKITLFLWLAVIINIISILLLVSIGLDKIPPFLAK